MSLNFIKLVAVSGLAVCLSLGINTSFAAENTLEITATKTLDILALIQDKKLVTEDGYIMLQSDGKITGLMKGAPVVGEWSAKDEHYCRSIQYGDGYVDTDCQIILNTKDGVIFHRHRGGGRKVGPYLVQIM